MHEHGYTLSYTYTYTDKRSHRQMGRDLRDCHITKQTNSTYSRIQQTYKLQADVRAHRQTYTHTHTHTQTNKPIYRHTTDTPTDSSLYISPPPHGGITPSGWWCPNATAHRRKAYTHSPPPIAAPRRRIPFPIGLQVDLQDCC